MQLTVNEADQEVSPLSDDAVHVYRPESKICKSARIRKISFFKPQNVKIIILITINFQWSTLYNN